MTQEEENLLIYEVAEKHHGYGDTKEDYFVFGEDLLALYKVRSQK
jgi:hypothetical protein